MSGFLAVDLDAKTAMPKVARAAGISVGDVAWGLMELWEHAWREKTDIATATVLAGCFGGVDAIGATIEALVAFGFLERLETGYRIRGAARYLRIEEGRSRGGKAAKGNLWPGGKRPSATPSAGSAEAEGKPSASREAAEQATRLDLGSTSAFQRTANSEQLEEVSGELLPDLRLVEPQPAAKKPRALSKQESWWQGAQAHTLERNPALVPEKHAPKVLNELLKEPLDEVGVHGLAAAWQRYLGDEHWRTKGWPLRGFVAQWRQFHRAEIAAGSRGGSGDYATPSKVYR